MANNSLGKGCGLAAAGCIGIPILAIAGLSALGMILFALGYKPEPTTTTVQTPAKQSPFVYVDRRTDAHGSVMELYACAGAFSEAEALAFFKERKANASGDRFYYAVLFDRKENAKFPNNPFTAHYGMDFDILEHVRAFYEYNKLNGYSELELKNGGHSKRIKL